MGNAKIESLSELYLALPPKNPRFLFPLKHRSLFSQALFLYRPASLKALLKRRFLKCLYPLLPILKPFTLSGQNLLQKYKLEKIRASLKNLGLWAGVYIPPGEHKAVVQVLNSQNQPIGYLKIGLSARGNRLIERETRALEFLKQQKPSSFSHPKVLQKGEKDGKIFAFLSSPVDLWPPSKIPLRLVLPVLREIFSMCQSKTLLENSIHAREILKKASSDSWLWSKAKQAFQTAAKREVPTGCLHSDFKLWNIFVEKATGRPFVIDWEFFKQDGLPLWDAFTFLFLPKIIKSPKSPPRLSKFLSLLKETARALGFENLPLEQLFILYLVDTVIFLEEYGHPDKRTQRTKEILISMLRSLRHEH